MELIWEANDWKEKSLKAVFPAGLGPDSVRVSDVSDYKVGQRTSQASVPRLSIWRSRSIFIQPWFRSQLSLVISSGNNVTHKWISTAPFSTGWVGESVITGVIHLRTGLRNPVSVKICSPGDVSTSQMTWSPLCIGFTIIVGVFVNMFLFRMCISYFCTAIVWLGLESSSSVTGPESGGSRN